MLDKFLEPIVVAGRPLGGTHPHTGWTATHQLPDMRIKAGLGSCNCCDYFMHGNNDTVVLIEETQLVRQIKELKSQYRYLQVDD